MNPHFWGRVVMALLGIIVALIAIVSWTMVSQAVVAEREPVETTPSEYGMAYENIEFLPRMPEERAEENPITLRGWWIPRPAQAEGPESAIVVVHGVDSNRARDPEPYMPLIRDLHERGFALLMFDLRAHGESDGEVMSAGYYERYDVLGAMDVAEDRYGIPTQRIGVLGFSMGGVAALLGATEEPRLRALVVDSAFANIDDLFAVEVADRTPLPEWTVNVVKPGMEVVARVRYGIRLSALKPEEFVGEIDFPLLFTHAEDDDRIAADHSERIAAAATHPETRLQSFPSGGHSAAFSEHAEEYLDVVTEYFQGRFDGT
ncbi:MAG: alpha/beta fold hydrolase [Dehalococcoidia bacterium]|nr:alpha/beta fold hydrolase [Dehalococcoidia bacterium]